MEGPLSQGSPEDVARRNQELFLQGEIEKQKMVDLIKSKGIMAGDRITVSTVQQIHNTEQVIGIDGAISVPSEVFYVGVGNEMGVGAVLLTEVEPNIVGNARRKKSFILKNQEVSVERGWRNSSSPDL